MFCGAHCSTFLCHFSAASTSTEHSPVTVSVALVHHWINVYRQTSEFLKRFLVQVAGYLLEHMTISRNTWPSLGTLPAQAWQNISNKSYSKFKCSSSQICYLFATSVACFPPAYSFCKYTDSVVEFHELQQFLGLFLFIDFPDHYELFY